MQYSTVLLLALGVAGAGAAVSWSAQNADGKTCLIFAADTINVKLNIQNDDNVTEAISFSIVNQTSIKGNCNDKLGDKPANSLEVSFFPNGEMQSATDGQNWRLWLYFTAADNAAFTLSDYTLEASPSSKFNFTTPQNFTKSASAELDVHATGVNAFKCSTSGLPLSSESSIDLKNTRVIANAILDGKDFPDNQQFEQCLLDTRTSDIVPIVVGACLAGLVAVVLIAYLVGRARAKRQGYASV